MDGDLLPTLDTWRPLARHEALVQTAADDGLIVYDQRVHHIHRLNASSLAVWLACDGTRSLTNLAQEVDPGLSAEVVLLALRQLAEADLLAHPPPDRLSADTSSRRALLRRLGPAGVLPVLISVSAPAAAQSGSCRGNGSSCGEHAQCCSGWCKSGADCDGFPGCAHPLSFCITGAACCSGNCDPIFGCTP